MSCLAPHSALSLVILLCKHVLFVSVPPSQPLCGYPGNLCLTLDKEAQITCRSDDGELVENSATRLRTR